MILSMSTSISLMVLSIIDNSCSRQFIFWHAVSRLLTNNVLSCFMACTQSLMESYFFVVSFNLARQISADLCSLSAFLVVNFDVYAIPSTFFTVSSNRVCKSPTSVFTFLMFSFLDVITASFSCLKFLNTSMCLNFNMANSWLWSSLSCPLSAISFSINCWLVFTNLFNDLANNMSHYS